MSFESAREGMGLLKKLWFFSLRENSVRTWPEPLSISLLLLGPECVLLGLTADFVRQNPFLWLIQMWSGLLISSQDLIARKLRSLSHPLIQIAIIYWMCLICARLYLNAGDMAACSLLELILWTRTYGHGQVNLQCNVCMKINKARCKVPGNHHSTFNLYEPDYPRYLV